MSERGRVSDREISSDTVEGNDAVCFTAGPEAAVIGAGTVHAYLAARRKCPKMAAGISLGALNAAAMQRVYRELHAAAGKGQQAEEAARWAWFRRYIDALSDQPWRILWDALPNRSDFFADMIPIRDGSLPDDLRDDEAAARRRQYLLVKLGRWLAKLPVSVSLLVGILVNYVRLVERYPFGARVFSLLGLVGHGLSLHARIALHMCLSPQFFPEHKFRDPQAASGTDPELHHCPIPLLPWINLISTTCLAGLAVLAAGALHVWDVNPGPSSSTWRTGALIALSLIVGTIAVRRRVATWPIARRIGRSRVPVAMAYMFSVANLLLFGAAAAAWILYLHEVGGWRWTMAWLNLAVGATVLDLLLNVLAVAFVLVPETRRWLFQRGFLLELPRPLFGWMVYGFIWLHLVSVVVYLALSAYLVAHVAPSESLPRAEVMVLAALWLLVLPALPLISLIAVVVVVWRVLNRIGRATAGWRKVAGWATTAIITAAVLVVGIVFCRHLLNWSAALFLVKSWVLWRAFGLVTFVATATWLVMAAVLSQPVSRRLLITWLLGRLGLRTSLIHDLYLRRKLLSLFDGAGPGGTVGTEPMPVVLVAASLQTLTRDGEPRLAYQLWARPDAPLVHALRAALAKVPIFEPVRVRGPELDWWLDPALRRDRGNATLFEQGIDLVDGSVVRQNPLPALFSYLHGSGLARSMATNNDVAHAAIHVVYGVPIESRPLAAQPTGSPSSSSAFRNTVVDVGLTSLRLSRRRDTQLEVAQTNIISRIEVESSRTGRGGGRPTHAIFADEIAPSNDLVVGDRLSPTPTEVLAGVAIGCRRSLETLYRHELAATSLPRTDDSVPCLEFLRSMSRWSGAPTPGLPEVCRQCTGRLRVPAPGSRGRSTVSVERTLSNAARLRTDHPQLARAEPRIVFVASGGVFRGAFHIGMLGALHSAGIKPDLVVGASVGTLMGGALGAMFVHGREVLPRLVEAFLQVDETVALTTTLKRAARELGIRGRAIRLSPRQVRAMLRRGARSDASFATTGAPAALVDALADLLLIPHRRTGEIAADFIAGRITDGLARLVEQLRSETIPRLDIERAVVGTSLLERVALQVLGDGSAASRLQRQPYQRKEIAFYGMTTDLTTQRSIVLGGEGLHPDAPYDFVEAALASSAFPAVFAARPEAAVFPGTGRSDVLLSDGGMFDNLPFIPAIEILSQAQRDDGTAMADGTTPLQRLRRRLDQPDLIIAGALDFVAERDERARQSFDSLGEVRSRAASLHHNSKIRAFELASQRIYGQLQRMRDGADPATGTARARFIDSIVNAAVLPVFPASADHLNGTFAFCRSTGLDRARVSRSIADGCYQMFLALAKEQERAESPETEHAPARLAAKTVRVLTARGRVCRVESNVDRTVTDDLCPYFTRNGDRFQCPFSEDGAGGDAEKGRLMRSVARACRRDRVHHRTQVARAL
jgi:predicted acylesterase/phospholipase RssA